jgi:IS30 family transposase
MTRAGRSTAASWPRPQEAKRMTLFDDEVATIVALRRKGRTFSYIAEEIGVCRDVIGRELKAQGIDTSPVRADRRACRGQGFWRCFDD